MHEFLVAFLGVFAGLFPIVNPLGMSPIFLRLTAGSTQAIRSRLAWRIAAGSFFLMAASLFAGAHILAFFGLTIPAVQIGGGLVVMAAGWQLLQQGSNVREREKQAPSVDEESMLSQAFFPLTMPLTVGPGTISVALTLGTRGTNAEYPGWVVAGALLAVVAVSLTIYLSYRFAAGVLHYLGKTGTDVFMRLSAFILLCLGAQILTNGIAGLPIFAGK
jgi:multiple antibiotic resistance protein